MATVTFRVHTSRYEENVPVSGDGEPSARYYLENPKMRNFGQVVIHGYTCKSPRGWTIGNTMSIQQSSVGLYPGADNAPTPRGSGETEGWGVAITGVKNGVMTVKAMACTKDTDVGWFDIVQKISGLIPPIKGLWYSVSVAKYVVGQIPTSGPKYTTHCGDLGDDHLYISVDKQGRLRVTAPSAEQWMQGIYENPHDPGPGGSYEYHVHEATIFHPVIQVKS